MNTKTRASIEKRKKTNGHGQAWKTILEARSSSRIRMMMFLVHEERYLRHDENSSGNWDIWSPSGQICSEETWTRDACSRPSLGERASWHEARMVVSGGTEHAFNSTPDGPVRRRWFAGSPGSLPPCGPFLPGRWAAPGWTPGERNPPRAPTWCTRFSPSGAFVKIASLSGHRRLVLQFEKVSRVSSVNTLRVNEGSEKEK